MKKVDIAFTTLFSTMFEEKCWQNSLYSFQFGHNIW